MCNARSTSSKRKGALCGQGKAKGGPTSCSTQTIYRAWSFSPFGLILASRQDLNMIHENLRG